MTSLPVCRAHELEIQPEPLRWLVEDLWANEGVGIVGGEPKCCKSFLALDLAVAVASGTPCLRRFAVRQPGRVLLYAAEDALHVVRERLDGIARAAGVELAQLDIHVITVPRLRLDVDDHARRLAATVAELEPKLLVLDPFVRLHRIDENSSAEVAPLLAFLRDLQRRNHLAVLLVHHAKKNGSKSRPGQALRGSSELHAWGDSNLYLRRTGDQLLLSIEHRAAPGRDDLRLELNTEGEALALQFVNAPAQDETPTARTPEDQIRQVLDEASAPLALAELSAACRLRKATLCQALAELTRCGDLTKAGGRYSLTG